MTPSLKALYPFTPESQERFVSEINTKICTICKLRKPLDDFHKKNRKYGDGRQSHCKACAPEYQRQWCEKKKERIDKITEDKTTLRTCTECGVPQLLINFEKNIGSKNGRRSICKSCTAPKKKKYRDDNIETIKAKAKVSPVRKAYMKQWYQDHKEEQREMLIEWHKLYPEYDKVRGKERRFKQYKVTKDWYNETLAAQGGGCAVCGSKDPKSNGGTFHIDHDHSCCGGGCNSCGKCVRGLLCSPCNTRLGILESVDWVKQAKAYLRKYPLKDASGNEQPSLFDEL